MQTIAKVCPSWPHNQMEFSAWREWSGQEVAFFVTTFCDLGHPGGSWYTANRDHALALAMKNLGKSTKKLHKFQTKSEKHDFL